MYFIYIGTYSDVDTTISLLLRFCARCRVGRMCAGVNVDRVVVNFCLVSGIPALVRSAAQPAAWVVFVLNQSPSWWQFASRRSVLTSCTLQHPQLLTSDRATAVLVKEARDVCDLNLLYWAYAACLLSCTTAMWMAVAVVLEHPLSELQLCLSTHMTCMCQDQATGAQQGQAATLLMCSSCWLRCSWSHEWTTCPFAHPGEKAKRRDPRTHQYDCEMCPAVVKVRLASSFLTTM